MSKDENEEKQHRESEDEDSKQDENYDPRLDFFSEKFDPLYALSKEKNQVPVYSVKCYDNLSAYQRAQQKKNDPEPAQKKNVKAGSSKGPDNVQTSERRFLPHQMPVQSVRKVRGNIFTRMEKMTGPLQLLKRCVDENLRIKVFTRNATSIRGYCIGYVTAFDKHWNLALKDITEVWTRRKRRKTSALVADENTSYQTQRIVLPPPVKILKETSKEEVCSRKVSQFIMRGEHVVSICLLDSAKR
ncbi:U7 snRNA-associated Sm-like protein LSm11 [Coccinella septempunctata]|uniref:U7 snRNA-associated Sm-like protein LSm11 n=1 Tax=Coccinella septempunctata TaxID=41139 RepID=UPI001D0666E8|nr:U7 snRNA-associated Sm-like protein LSm11 [Coccinella septempunctata]